MCPVRTKLRPAVSVRRAGRAVGVAPDAVVYADQRDRVDLLRRILDSVGESYPDQRVLTDILNRIDSMRTDLAIRFEQAFGSAADTWLRLQNVYDLAQARQTGCEITRTDRATCRKPVDRTPLAAGYVALENPARTGYSAIQKMCSEGPRRPMSRVGSKNAEYQA